MSQTKFDYRIKLLSGNNVVLVEASGFESEIFMPNIINGRIAFQNIIPNRRCCFTTSKIGQRASSPNTRKSMTTANTKGWRIPAGQEAIGLSPIPCSTPVYDHLTGKENTFKNRTPRSPHEQSSRSTSLLATPKAVRCAPSPFEVVKDTLVQIPSGIKVMRLYRNPTPCLTKRIGIISPDSPESGGIQRCESFRLPLPKGAQNSTILKPTQASLQKQSFTPGATVKWRKCITPVRTYTRRSNNVEPKRFSGSNILKTMHSSKVIPSFRANPTQGTKGSNKIELRKRKLVVDQKVSISPQSFKNQQKEMNIRKKQSQLPRSKKQYEKIKETAFDLLCKPSRGTTMSSELQQQFHKSCINKTCSTYPKYKLLCHMPALENDRESRQLLAKLKTEQNDLNEKIKKTTANENNNNIAINLECIKPRTPLANSSKLDR